jgi:large subunit ribosomal protein L15
MPPRIPALTAVLRPAQHSSLANFLAPFLQSSQQARNSSILANLSDRKEAYSKRIRRGRGPSSGKGKTSGRGHKGQKQHGKVPARFQGGQTPDEIVHHKRGQDNTSEQYVLR